MCTVCGCGEGETTLEGGTHSHEHGPEHHHDHSHGHEHGHDGDGHLHYGQGPAHAHAPGLSQSRMVQIERDILSKNAEYAEANRARFAAQGTLALNLVSSPGSGKTTLLVETLKRLQDRFPLGVIEGDQQTSNDADRIRATGAPAIQVNTGKGCHLDAHMVGHALDHLGSAAQGVLFIENVGNLVCPAGFDLGEAHKVVILSATEGEDKPLKYPDMFHAADLMLLNKTDLLPYVDFNVDKCIEYVRRINPDISIIQLSARSGEGVDDWLAWIEAERAGALRGRLATLEAEMAALKAELA
ncbi:MAG: hydrogenase nickel incorporation protein HypB [Acidihalobacter sp.]|uniref:hydrogenase nickel incorporation protein HypB n=1 Tax=Acidihalobacter sp. TaxID=1872108 RepID=UPI00307F09E8